MFRKFIKFTIDITSVIILTLSLICDSTWASYLNTIPAPKFQKGMCYVTWSPMGYVSAKSDESLKSMADTGVNYVQIVVTWYQEEFDSVVIKAEDERTPTDQSVRHAIKKAHEYGMAVMLKPHVDLIRSDGNCRADIGFSDPEKWERWFSNYKKFIKYYAAMAQEENVEIFCVGTELEYTATQVESWTERIIPMVREVFSGKITYASNWDNYKNIKFWDKLDYIGIDAYFPLVNKDNPTYQEIKDAWGKWVKEIDEWQKTVNKPIIFTECGYCSADSSAKRPWEEIFCDKVNLQLQADCYRALLETFCDKPWFVGVYWWAWNTYAGSGGKNHSRFTPQNKPAVACLKTWYRDILRDRPQM